MTVGSFCTGICAPECAWRSLGWEPPFFSEINPFACAVPVLAWIGRRIELVERVIKESGVAA